ncbi:hypothetical protein AAHC03_019228 [Spirometra sp. Aus1]
MTQNLEERSLPEPCCRRRTSSMTWQPWKSSDGSSEPRSPNTMNSISPCSTSPPSQMKLPMDPDHCWPNSEVQKEPTDLSLKGSKNPPPPSPPAPTQFPPFALIPTPDVMLTHLKSESTSKQQPMITPNLLPLPYLIPPALYQADYSAWLAFFASTLTGSPAGLRPPAAASTPLAPRRVSGSPSTSVTLTAGSGEYQTPPRYQPPKNRLLTDPAASQGEAAGGVACQDFGSWPPLVPGSPCVSPAPHACRLCDKVYSQPSALKMHVRTHTLPCQCTYCGKSFSRKWLLKGHERTHTGERPYQCATCHRCFADRSNLRAHMQTHQSDKRYKCSACPRSFSRMGLLYKHYSQSSACGAAIARPSAVSQAG